jgi:hypothetical protein
MTSEGTIASHALRTGGGLTVIKIICRKDQIDEFGKQALNQVT